MHAAQLTGNREMRFARPAPGDPSLAFPGPAPTVPAMKFSWFLALRYLKPKRTFISIITVISIAGVALGVGVLIVVIAVMSGFEKRIKDEWLKVEPPLYLIDEGRSWMPAEDPAAKEAALVWSKVLPKVKSFPGVQGASPFINVVSLLQQAPPKEFDDMDIKVDPGSIPPPEPPSEPGASPPDVAPPAVADSPPPAAEPAAEPEPPAALPGEKEKVTGLDRTRPLAHSIIIGVDTDDVDQMERYSKRFRELLNRKRTIKGLAQKVPSALGEFDIAGESIVLSEDVVSKFSRGADAGHFQVGETTVNLFGPSLMNEIIDVNEENREAQGDKEKQEEVNRKDRNYPAPDQLTISGIFNDDKQQGVGYVSLKTAQRLAGAGKAVDGIAIELSDPYDAPAMAAKLEAANLLPPGWRTETWIERHRQQFEAVANERSMMYIVLGFISVVAAFCIMNTMITMAVQKRREIGMMRALGAKTSHIVSLFMTKGFIVGLFGTGIGYGLGLLVLHFRNDLRTWINDRFGHQIFDSSIYGLSEIPSDLRTLDEVAICSIAFVLCTLAAVPPAWMVGRMEPARALRNDR